MPEEPFLADMSPPGRKAVSFKPLEQLSRGGNSTAEAKDVQPTVHLKNPHTAIRDLCRDAMLIVEKGKGFHASENRHGDLQVIRSHALRIIENTTVLVQYEEEHP